MSPKIRKINWIELEELNSKLTNKLNSENFDSILCIGSGGLILGKLVADESNTPLSVIIAESYNRGKKTNHQTKISEIASIYPLKGKLLIIDDLVDSGQTILKIIEIVKKNPKISEIKTAVLFKKFQSQITPNFFVEETSDWIIFPYEKKEFS